MLRYYDQWMNHLFSHKTTSKLAPELRVDIVQENETNSECDLAIYNDAQTSPSVSESTMTPIREVSPQAPIPSLDNAKEWIAAQREQLTLLIKEDSLQKVEALLQTSLNDIKAIAEFHLECCESRFSKSKNRYETFDDFLNYLDSLQHQFKSLLQGGMRLFHPDHILNTTHSHTMNALITRYSQDYLQQSRNYLNQFKNYYSHIGEFYKHSQQTFQRTHSFREPSNLGQRIQELTQSFEELKQSFKEFDKKLKEFDARLDQYEARRVQDKAMLEANHAKMDAEMEEIMDLFKRQQPSLTHPQILNEESGYSNAGSSVQHFKHT